MTKLLLDEMLAPRIAEQLRRRGHDVVAVAERPGLCSIPDDDLLANAFDEGRVLVTMNVGDFARIDAAWKSQGRAHAGLLLVPSAAFPQDRGFVGRLVRTLDRAMSDGTVPRPDAVTFASGPSPTSARRRRSR